MRELNQKSRFLLASHYIDFKEAFPSIDTFYIQYHTIWSN